MNNDLGLRYLKYLKLIIEFGVVRKYYPTSHCTKEMANKLWMVLSYRNMAYMNACVNTVVEITIITN